MALQRAVRRSLGTCACDWKLSGPGSGRVSLQGACRSAEVLRQQRGRRREASVHVCAALAAESCGIVTVSKSAARIWLPVCGLVCACCHARTGNSCQAAVTQNMPEHMASSLSHAKAGQLLQHHAPMMHGSIKCLVGQYIHAALLDWLCLWQRSTRAAAREQVCIGCQKLGSFC